MTSFIIKAIGVLSMFLRATVNVGNGTGNGNGNGKGRQNYKLQSSRGEVSLSVLLPGKNCDCYLSLGLY